MLNNTSTPSNAPPLSSIQDGDDDMTDEEWERRYKQNMKIRGVKLPSAGAELDAMLDTIPLFATSKPTLELYDGQQVSSSSTATTDDDDEVTELSANVRDHAAIQALVDETPAIERAENLKTSGNEAWKLGNSIKQQLQQNQQHLSVLKDIQADDRTEDVQREIAELEDKVMHQQKAYKKRYHDAVVYYTQGSDVKCESWLVNAHLYANRAQAHISLQNYGYAINDCNAALHLDPYHPKAYYRAASACMQLEKYTAAMNYVEQALNIADHPKAEHRFTQKEVKALQELKQQIESRQQALKQAEVEKQRQQHLQSKQQTMLIKELSRHNLRLGEHLFDSSMYPAITHIDKATTQLVLPILILYPQHQQTDFISSASLSDRLIDHLRLVLPAGQYPPWDEQHQYSLDAVRVYIELTRNADIDMKLKATKLPSNVHVSDESAQIDINTTQTLKQILTAPMMQTLDYAIPGVVSLWVEPKSRATSATQQSSQPSSTAATEVRCKHCQRLPSATEKFATCAGCQSVIYCSAECQKLDWKAGHKKQCKR